MTVTSREELVDAALARIEVLDSLRRRAFCSHAPHWDVSLPQLYILTLIQERGPRTVSELASLLSVSAPSVSSILDRMEERNLIVRVRDEEDRRVVRVELTSNGRQAFSEVGGLQVERTRRLLDVLNEREIEDLIAGIDALSTGLSRLGVGST